MSRMVQIRNVPDKVHRTLKARAAQAGLTLSEYLLRHVASAAERPTVDDILERIASRGRGRPLDVVGALRAERQSR